MSFYLNLPCFRDSRPVYSLLLTFLIHVHCNESESSELGTYIINLMSNVHSIWY